MLSPDVTKRPATPLRWMALAVCVLLSGGLALSCGESDPDDAENTADEVPVKEIRLDKTSESVKVMETVQLTAILSPDNATDKHVSWSSSDEEIAKVDDNGLVYGINPGLAVISAKASSGLVATCEIIVLGEDDYVAVTAITLDRNEAEIGIGESFQLIATVYPESATEKTVSWRSSSTSRASVSSDGTVTGGKAGTATITAYIGDVSATCTVTVTNKATAITLNRTEAQLVVGNILYLYATVTPEDSPSAQALVWASSDENVATVDQSGKVTALAAGTTEISASADGVSGTCIITVENVSGGHEGTGDENWK